MKKLLFAVIVCAILSSCSKDESTQDASSSSLFVKSIEFGHVSSSGDDRSVCYDIIYDEKGCVKQYVEYWSALSDNYVKYDFSYSGNAMTIVEKRSTSTGDATTYNIQLNDKGYASKVEWHWVADGPHQMDYVCEITYDNNGYIKSIMEEEYRDGLYDGECYYQYVWENGNLITSHYSDLGLEEYEEDYRYTQYENNLNIDVNNLIECYDNPTDLLSILGAFNFLGNKSKNLVKDNGWQKYTYHFDENDILTLVKFMSEPGYPQYGVDYRRFKY